MPKSILYTQYFKSGRHVANHIRYLDKQSPIFDQNGNTINPEDAVRDAETYKKNQKWRHIYSLKPEDCDRLFLDREYMRNLVAAKSSELAKAYNIRPENLRVVASWHPKDHHPHLHLVMYSTNPREGILYGAKSESKGQIMNKATRAVKSAFTNEIFKDDLEMLKVGKGELRNKLQLEVEKQLQSIVKSNPVYTMPSETVSRLKEIAADLNSLSGKKVYGFIPADTKVKVNDLLRYLIDKDPILAARYEAYAKSHSQLIRTYVDNSKTIAKKMEAWEERFFAPKKGDSTQLHNQIIKAALAVDAAGGQKRANSTERNGYTEKSAAAVARGMMYNLGKLLHEQQCYNQAQNNAAAPALRNKRLKKVTHRQNRDRNIYENEFER